MTENWVGWVKLSYNERDISNDKTWMIKVTFLKYIVVDLFDWFDHWSTTSIVPIRDMNII